MHLDKLKRLASATRHLHCSLHLQLLTIPTLEDNTPLLLNIVHFTRFEIRDVARPRIATLPTIEESGSEAPRMNRKQIPIQGTGAQLLMSLFVLTGPTFIIVL